MARRARFGTTLRFEQEAELLHGPWLGSLLTAPTNRADGDEAWSFVNEVDRHRAWLANEDLVAEFAADRPGRRPWAWWRYRAGRPEHLAPEPGIRGRTTADGIAAHMEYEVEPIRYLAEHGHLSDDEIEYLRAKGEAAWARVGSDAEQYTSYGGDLRAGHSTRGLGADRWRGEMPSTKRRVRPGVMSLGLCTHHGSPHRRP